MTESKKTGADIDRPGCVFVVSGPSGVGKNTLADRIVEEGVADRAVTATTRMPRDSEEDAVDYFFVNEAKFLKWREQGVLLEWNRYGGHLYGTPLFSLERTAGSGKAVLLVIDVGGGLNLKKIFENITLIFITPPSMKALEERLRNRGDESEESIRKRLLIAEKELGCKDKYDYVVVNDELDKAVEEIKKIITVNSRETF